MTPESVNEVVFIDFEFLAGDGERPRPVCFVAIEQRSGRIIRTWVEDGAPKLPPFATGPNVVVVAYFACAELGCYQALDWPFPRLILDLYPEFRIATNGLTLPHGRGLLGAMQWFGLDGIEASKKDRLRKRILDGGPYSAEERRAILDYCQSDVEALVKLYPRLIGDTTNLVPALWRGEYMKVIASAEYNGLPVDAALYRQMVKRWPELQSSAIERVNARIPIFEAGHFRISLFEKWLHGQRLLTDWPLTPTGGLALDEDTFRDAAARYPQIEPPPASPPIYSDKCTSRI